MFLTFKAYREAEKKAKELGICYTAEFGIGYVMTKYPLLFWLEILVPPLVIFCILIITYGGK